MLLLILLNLESIVLRSDYSISHFTLKLMDMIGITGADTGSEILWILSILESVFLLLIFYWQFLFASDDLCILSPATPALPVLIGEIRHWFFWRCRVSKIFRFFAHGKSCCFLPSTRSTALLWRGERRSVFEFFKTLALSDLPPPLPV
jgi:hypothetical protein